MNKKIIAVVLTLIIITSIMIVMGPSIFLKKDSRL